MNQRIHYKKLTHKTLSVMFKICSILMLCAIVLISCDDEDTVDYTKDIKISQYVRDNYYQDAQQLYMNEIINNPNHPNYNNTTLDVQEIETILKHIQAVYDLNVPERDTVFNVYNIHGYYCYSFNAISLKVTPDDPAINNLVNDIYPTGNSQFDDLLSTYQFDYVDPAYSYPKFPWLTIYFKQEYNLIPIVDEFEKLPFVTYSEFNRGCIGDGNTITLKRGDNSAIITFSIGRGDCPAGCIYHRYWEFVINSGHAEFYRSYEN